MEIFNDIKWIQIVFAFLIVILGYFVARWLSIVSEKSMVKRMSRHQAMLLRRVIFYGLFILFFVSALHQIGFTLSVIIGAAGILTVAIGFASQTAASNLISGIFLLFEHPFQVGDFIQVNNQSGTVDSMDLLSTKLMTGDNLLIRIPNEMLIKSPITNFSYCPTRRIDLLINIPYDINVDLVKQLILDLTKEEKGVNPKPQPQIILNQFLDSAIELKLMCWTKNADFTETKSRLQEKIKQAFDKENIGMPYPQLTIHQG